MKLSARTIIFIGFILVSANTIQAQNDSAERTFTISGRVSLEGVTIKGLPGDPVTTSGDVTYSVIVPYGWSGTVVPEKEGFMFRPTSRTYNRVISDLNEQNYQEEVITLTISGNTRIGEVEIVGLPGNPVADYQGNYRCTIPYGWSGSVTPKKVGYTFDPPSRTYDKVVSNWHNESYIPSIITLVISGSVGQPGVLMRGLPGNPVSDADGLYSAAVEYGWSGVVEPDMDGVSFDPPHRQYDTLTSNISNQYYHPTRVASTQMFESSGNRKVVIVPSTEVKAEEFETTMEDMRVMLHILEEKVINEPSMIRGVLMDYGDFFGQNNQTSKAVYIQGYGVLFLMEVDFPLVFPSEPQQDEPEQIERDVDPVWQEARERVFSPKDETSGIMTGVEPESIPQRVEQLKKEFIRSLKHASNIRNLGQDELVVLNVAGLNQQSGLAVSYGAAGGRMGRSGRSRRGMIDPMMGGRSRVDTRTGRRIQGTVEEMYDMMGGSRGSAGYGGAGYGGGGYGGGGFMMGGMMAGSSSSNVLTIRANKSDIDAFAKGVIDFEEFQKKVTIFIY